MGDFLSELWAFMKERKKFWLLPIIVMLVLLAGGIGLIARSLRAHSGSHKSGSEA